MRFIAPWDVLMWTFRRDTRDVIRLYDKLSGIMRLATGGMSFNFGLWNDSCTDPLSAQSNMARHMGSIAELHAGLRVADVGCGLAGPAQLWRRSVPDLDVVCIDVNLHTLVDAASDANAVAGSAVSLPVASGSVDVVLALESAHHFRPLGVFATESARVLKSGGLACLAVPVTGCNYRLNKLGSLYVTWSSERYDVSRVRNSMVDAGFTILYEQMVGKSVYEPLAAYYIKNRDAIKRRITSQYPWYVEWLLYRSMLDMNNASKEGIIDYIVMKCRI